MKILEEQADQIRKKKILLNVQKNIQLLERSPKQSSIGAKKESGRGKSFEHRSSSNKLDPIKIQEGRRTSSGRKSSLFMDVKQKRISLVLQSFRIDARECSGAMISSCVDEVINALVRNSLAAIKQGSIIIKKQYLANVLTFIIQSLSGLTKSYNNGQMQLLSPFLQQLSEMTTVKRRQNKSATLSLEKSINRKIDPKYYACQLVEANKKIGQLHEEIALLKDQLEKAEQKLQYISQICQDKKKECLQWEKKEKDCKRQYEENSLKNQELRLNIEFKRAQIQSAKQEAHKLATYVFSQKEWPLIQLISKQYKTIIDEIFDYAVFLQHNGYYSSMAFEPQPFSAVQKHMEQDMKRINEFIMRENETVESKAKKMREFVLDSMRKFKIKDAQMGEVNRAKTEAVKKFIAMMQKWVENFEIKEEHLGYLRTQYVIDSKNINELFDKLLETQAPQSQKIDDIKKMQNYWRSVEETFKFGTFFY